MKKEYTKPQVVFEDFSLSTGIAANCEKDANFAKGSCGVIHYAPGITIFTNAAMGCLTVQTEQIPTGYGQYDGLCYHNPSETYNLFNS